MVNQGNLRLGDITEGWLVHILRKCEVTKQTEKSKIPNIPALATQNNVRTGLTSLPHATSISVPGMNEPSSRFLFTLYSTMTVPFRVTADVPNLHHPSRQPTRCAFGSLEGLAEEDDLELVVDGQDTSTGNTTEDVGTSTLEERPDTLLGNNLPGGIERVLVLDGLTRSHHHAAADGVEGVRGDTGTSGDAPSEGERGKEVAGEGTGEDDGLKRVVHSEVETTVHDDTGDGGHEATVETGNTVGRKGLAVDIDEAVELALTTLGGVLGVVGKTSTRVVERVHEHERSRTSGLKRTC